jgi:hypothetical protein
MNVAREILLEAVSILCVHENVNKEYVLSVYTPTEIFNKVRQYRKEREENMDAIRANW